MRYAVFCCMGLGDGLLTLILSNNLKRAGHEVVTFHPFLNELQDWFPDLPIRPFPQGDLPSFDHYFIIYEKSSWMQKILQTCLLHYRDRTTVLNPIATPNSDYPFWEEGRFDGTLPFAENLYRFCRNLLHIEDATKENGLRPPVDLIPHPKRVILHPTSSRKGKNWTPSKFERLAQLLQQEGNEPVFILTQKEKLEWPRVNAPSFENLSALARFVAESGSMVGNDSGIGHLASCLGLPTLIICRSKLAADFWRPDWKRGEVIYPPRWIPNLKGLRWRDQRWQWFVPVSRVHRSFRALQNGRRANV